MGIAFDLNAFLPATFAFFILFWIVIFLENYRHFPEMERDPRLWTSFVNATELTVTIVVFSAIGIYLIMNALGK